MGRLLPLLVPVLLAVAGLAAGVGAGLALRPAPEPGEAGAVAEPTGPRDFVRLNNQFVVPVVQDGLVRSLVILSLSLEVDAGAATAVYAAEPKLRDAFLQVLFDHANAGGFSGAFTGAGTMAALREALREAAQGVLGASAHGVLIIDMVRQDS